MLLNHSVCWDFCSSFLLSFKVFNRAGIFLSCLEIFRVKLCVFRKIEREVAWEKRGMGESGKQTQLSRYRPGGKMKEESNVFNGLKKSFKKGGRKVGMCEIVWLVQRQRPIGLVTTHVNGFSFVIYRM